MFGHMFALIIPAIKILLKLPSMLLITMRADYGSRARTGHNGSGIAQHKSKMGYKPPIR